MHTGSVKEVRQVFLPPLCSMFQVGISHIGSREERMNVRRCNMDGSDGWPEWRESRTWQSQLEPSDERDITDCKSKSIA